MKGVEEAAKLLADFDFSGANCQSIFLYGKSNKPYGGVTGMSAGEPITGIINNDCLQWTAEQWREHIERLIPVWAADMVKMITVWVRLEFNDSTSVAIEARDVNEVNGFDRIVIDERPARVVILNATETASISGARGVARLINGIPQERYELTELDMPEALVYYQKNALHHPKFR